ncbi:hypothetical protein LAUMK4_00378 [Mycobacterium persicum]|uniref:PE family protein n=1 Tax=Mycobacterium persicum TaxID=1487726 RepID=A0AB38UMC8_9MYCO|nr:hypothetical protein LAUMK15_00731 [Mycobacterium persicum]VAZ81788.1 hypothetical protein LAUMK42_00591 [Mycobacterium persicum]VAZ87432.1 hypothetical protein LAUMK4_00378 [Mycobacterium persicum]
MPFVMTQPAVDAAGGATNAGAADPGGARR